MGVAAALFDKPIGTATGYGMAKCLMAVLALAASACSSLPVLVPDMARAPARTIQLEGAHGMLTARRSTEVLDRLKHGSEETSIFDRHLAEEQAIAGSPLTVGNKVHLLQDGPDTYAYMFAAIRDAKNHIHMETYIIEDDETGNHFATALIEKQRQGVQVRLVYDSVGSINTPAAFFQRLTDSGIKVLEFNPINPLTAGTDWEVNQRDHRKLLIVDGRIAFLGGINISSVYSGGSSRKRSAQPRQKTTAWRDTHLQVEGPVVGEFQKLFLATWESQSGEAIASDNHYPRLANVGNEVVRGIGSSPDEPFSLIYATLISAIRSAETSICLTNAYFVPDPQLLEALKDTVLRKVDVKLLLPGKTDSWLVLHAGHSYYTELLEAGVKIYERRNVLLHSKTALVDGVWSTIGSTNLDWRSFLHNHEINAVILGQEFGTGMQAMFDRDITDSDPVTLEKWKRRPLVERLKETVARLWQYWL